MENIEKLKDYMRCEGIGKDIYTDNNVDAIFNEIADILLKKCILKVGTKLYRILEIEFYLFSDTHKDIIAYPRTDKEGGEWFFHPSGVDLCFKSACKTKEKHFILDETENTFGGILIRSIVEVDADMKAVENGVVNGPIKCMDVLFKSFGAFDDNRTLCQIAEIKESEKESSEKFTNTIRHIPVDDDGKKIQTILSENYGIKRKEQEEKDINKWSPILKEYRLNHNWRYYIEREDFFRGYDASPFKHKKS